MQKIENVTFNSYFYKKYPDLIKRNQKKKQQQLQQLETDDKVEETSTDGKRLIGKA